MTAPILTIPSDLGRFVVNGEAFHQGLDLWLTFLDFFFFFLICEVAKATVLTIDVDDLLDKQANISKSETCKVKCSDCM